ncbi:N-methyl-L-tryptophan oxidase [Amycolatopsis sacchari]|uniref:N-methyl-L-tryptophan oxidase n=1 Tax=Amycolatopsis sacchari TaxID=115433 RepID=UPI003EB7FCAB
MSTSPSVAVLGTGAVGAMTLWRLAARGARAVGFDTYAPGHDRGASGGESRIFRTAYKEGAHYVPLLRESRLLWTELERAGGTRLLHLVGGVTVGAAEDPVVRAVQESGVDVEVLSGREAARRVPEHPLAEGEVLVLDREAGYLRPEVAMLTAVDEAQRHGAELRCRTRVSAVEPDGTGVLVTTGAGTERFDAAVVTPGAWAKQLLPHLPVQARRITSAWFPRRDAALFDPERCPIAIRVGAHAFSCFPALDGFGVKVNAHGGGWPPVESPESLPRSAEPELLARLHAAVTATLPGLRPDPVRIATYADGFTPDGHGLLGPLTGNLVLATGFSGHGFKLAPVFGDIAADLVLSGGTRRAIAPLSPHRF